MNNSSLLTADGPTHVKIVVVALALATLVSALGIVARLSDGAFVDRQEARVIKAVKPVTAATAEQTLVR